MTEALHKRADAVRNRARVIAAAEAVFAERGTEASVPEVAERAGVGKATVYRSFPTKEHLIAAIVIERLADFERRALERLGDPDAWAALRDLLAEGAERHCADRSISAGFADASSLPEVQVARDAMWAALGALMERAKEQGTLRADATPEDFRILWAGTARMLIGDGVSDVAQWRRYAGLVLRALSA